MQWLIGGLSPAYDYYGYSSLPRTELHEYVRPSILRQAQDQGERGDDGLRVNAEQELMINRGRMAKKFFQLCTPANL